MSRSRLSLFLSIATLSRFCHGSKLLLPASNKTAFLVSSSGDIRNFGVTGGASLSSTNNMTRTTTVDKEYPGTAVERMVAVRERVKKITSAELTNVPWEDVRRKILWAGGLKDLPNAIPGQGYTGHAFNDYNHVDLTCMLNRDNENDGSVKEISIGNSLGSGIQIASLPELGTGGSWSTCANGCNVDPPQDVAHIQFQSRIAFKLVWAPTSNYDTFVLVDDDGKFLASGQPSGVLPNLRQRQMNYNLVKGSKYATAANDIVRNVSAE